MFLVLSLLAGCVADGGKVFAKDVLKQNSDADIFQYDGLIYSNISELEWFEEEKERYIKHNLLGEIKKQITIIEEGTAIYQNRYGKSIPKRSIIK